MRERPGEGEREFTEDLNPQALEIVASCKVEPSLKNAAPDTRYQFERTGYFVSDPVDSRDGKLVFNRTVTLRDSWAKMKDK